MISAIKSSCPDEISVPSATCMFLCLRVICCASTCNLCSLSILVLSFDSVLFCYSFVSSESPASPEKSACSTDDVPGWFRYSKRLAWLCSFRILSPAKEMSISIGGSIGPRASGHQSILVLILN